MPIANQSERFWSDMFDYGAMLAAKSVEPGAPTWPGVWAPEQVLKGWEGTNLAAYETDFVSASTATRSLDSVLYSVRTVRLYLLAVEESH